MNTDLQSYEEIWPARLLHVPSMTSFEWEPDNVYGGIEEPKFAVFSYTWGRWEVPWSGGASSLPIKNVPWKVPSIDPARFTVAQFERAIQRATEKVDFLWLDVACIDQVDEAAKADQVGKQAGIFMNASHKYVWLHGTPLAQLQSLTDGIMHLAARLSGDETHEVSFPGFPELTHLVHYGADPGSPAACIHEPEWLQAVASTARAIVQDPWFSSLWTLQECYLGRNATLLSQEAEPATRQGFGDHELDTLVNSFGEIETAVREWLAQLRRERPAIRDAALHIAYLEDTLDALSPLVCQAWDFQPLIYCAASRRTASNPLDQVYGIMQVFGLRLGKAAEPERDFTLVELQDQFSLALLAADPVNSQYFVHEVEPAAGEAWRLSKRMRIPAFLDVIGVWSIPRCEIGPAGDASPTTSSSIGDTGMGPVFQGQACSMPEIMRFWAHLEPLVYEHENLVVGNRIAVQCIALDASREVATGMPAELLTTEDDSFETQQRLAGELVRLFRPDDVMVFLLGDVAETNFGELYEMTAEEPEFVHKGSGEIIGSVGLIVRRTMMMECGPTWRRVGICVWPQFGPGSVDEDPFQYVEAVLS
ncbi:hypothetical protein BJY01DRAFT_221128 [Aspergillus pseudoustus]|uniref:Heterokaryon incompatibility domain-containing protein n=1 Tax=Aspergillus pseudoustus TaxID=1810923 RepID=A0ABR4JBG3_9EURO